MKFVLALGQMDVSLGDPDANVARARALAAEAARRGAALLLLPELWPTGYDLGRAPEHAAATDAGPFAVMAGLAREHRLHVYGSCLSALGPGRVGNTGVLFGPDGRALGEYSKLHLFRLMDEHRHLTPGARPVLAEAPWGRTGLAVCYDLRFPELFRGYALAGAAITLLCAEWPRPRLEHWRTLLRARAIEDQMYVAACNRVGTSAGVSFFGHSCVIDPSGEAVVEGGDEEGLLTAEVDLARVAAARAHIPVFGDRRPDAYQYDL